MLHLTEMASFLNFDAVSVKVYVIGMYIKIIDVQLRVLQVPYFICKLSFVKLQITSSNECTVY
jgi:hypothetical protein